MPRQPAHSFNVVIVKLPNKRRRYRCGGRGAHPKQEQPVLLRSLFTLQSLQL
jgi:hypothetical protein